jgi:hypothetical protein
MLKLILICFLFLTCPAVAFDPNNPAAFGYVLTFDDEFNTINTIDVNATGNPGYNWYTKEFFGFQTTPASDITVSGGVLTLSANSTSDCPANYCIATAAPAANAQGYVGQVFSGSQGGWYIEIRVNFDPTIVGTNGTPSIWLMALQHLMATCPGNCADQWPGQAANYEYFMEDDIFEYNVPGAGGKSFSTNKHVWYGTYTTSCGFYCQYSPPLNYYVTLSADPIWSNWHSLGQLYVPGTPANGNIGSFTFYLDGDPVICSNSYPCANQWVQSGLGTPPPTDLSVTDTQSYALILGTGQNATNTGPIPFNIDYVRVWQPGVRAAGIRGYTNANSLSRR